MAQPVRKSGMKEVPLSEVKDDLSRFLREAGEREIVITRHGKPAGVLIGFKTEDDWFDYRLENDPRFLDRIQSARDSLRAGRGGLRIGPGAGSERLVVGHQHPRAALNRTRAVVFPLDLQHCLARFPGQAVTTSY